MQPILSAAYAIGRSGPRLAARFPSGRLALTAGSVDESVFRMNRSQTIVARNLATTAKEMSYFEKKKALKEERRKNFHEREERKERVKVRREGRPMNVMRNEFRSFFVAKEVNESRMDRVARREGKGWKVNVAVILERENVALPTREPWEVAYDELEKHLEQYKGRELPDIWKYGPSNDNFGGMDDDGDDDDESFGTSTKKKEARKTIQEIHEEFYPPDIFEETTEADLSGDIRTINRKQGSSLFLVVKDGDSDQWRLPVVDVQEDETLLAAGRRLMEEKVGPSVEYWCPSRAPWSVELTALPSEEERTKTGLYGTKTFFMKFVHWEGDLVKDSLAVKDFAWLDKDEITAHLREVGEENAAKFHHYML
mmetsp:Transcript_17587/g.36429  ORF Transcript_17587/g.36429 Transcript_17587/m.36429 type:complete len:368 (-) Transcript_17587:42-1145(-)